jgi:hypothetical protein
VIWLGERRGYLSDWVTQKWVQVTGRHVDLESHPWLAGPVGKTNGIGKRFFEDLAKAENLTVRKGSREGLIPHIEVLSGPDFEPTRVHSAVRCFYEQTGAYDLDAWGEWYGAFRPFGRVLAALFSRRLQQLNVPLSALDTSRGVTSEIIQLVDPATGSVRYTGWVRELIGTRNVLYAGSYSVCRLPGHDSPCVKVVFPLPNGNAMVIMRAEAHNDGSMSVTSSGSSFGDPGFYFTVHDTTGGIWARYLKTLRESIRVFASGDDVRGDHVLTLWRATFLRLHYRLKRRAGSDVAAI